jgi:hypothetical protein
VLSVLKWLVMRLAAVRWIVKILGGLAVLAPLAFLIKLIGLPILAVLGVLALPVLFVLFIFGLPIFLVLIAGAGVMGLLFAMLSIGLVALKIGLLVVLPIYLIFKLGSWIFGRRSRRNGDSGSSTGGSAAEPIDGIDPV